MVKLGKAGGEFAGARAGSGNDDERTSGFNVGIGAVTFVGNDGSDIGRIAFGESMEIGFDFIVF